MSLNTNQCEFIKKNNERCKRIINKDENYCWQHIDSEISESLESVELLETLPDEIIQYILNPYIDYINESELIEHLTGNRVKLNIDPHLSYEIQYGNFDKNLIKTTYLDLKLIKSESWYMNGNKYFIKNYKNQKLDGISEYWYDNGNKTSTRNYKNGKLEGISEGWYLNGNKRFISNYKNDKLDGISEGWYKSGHKEFIENYKNGILIEYTDFDEK